MPEIHVIVPDASLRGAIVEGLALVDLSAAQENGTMAAAMEDTSAIAIILDEAAADKKALKIFQESAVAEKARRVFFLGAAEAAWADDKSVEPFPKPLRLGHLLSRLTFHLRTRARTQNVAVVFGPWRLELQNRQIVRREDETIIRLTEKETALLDYLAQSGAPVSREELLDAVWGYDGRIDTHTLETHIYQLRRKLDPDGKSGNFLVNEQGAYHLKDS